MSMESSCPKPNIKRECSVPIPTASIQGLTPRNVSPEKRSRTIQIECQKKNNVEKIIHHCLNTKATTASNEIDMNVTEYADDKVETYANIVDRKLRDINLRRGSKRFVDINVVSDSIDELVCGQCAKERVHEAEDKLMKQFKDFIGKDAKCADVAEKFDRFRKKNRRRKEPKNENKCKLSLIDDVLGISSDISLQCETCTTHRYPMTIPRKRRKGQTKCTDAEENVIAILLPFITGVGPTELETILSMQGLPNSKHY